MTNKRYGLGQRLGEFNVDKWTLYQVAQYCDQLVPDGFGGKEPRFTCNAWLVEQRKAYDVINDICSIFRAMPVWNGREFTVVMDRPADPVWTYTNANVVNGEFSYQYSALKARHNEIHVEYIDASDSYEKKVEVVSDDALIRRYGLNIKKVTAFGCTSRGQAHRTGKWILETERLETKTVTFSVGAEGLMHIPGDVIRVADSDYAATNIGGRVLAIDGRKAILDREIEINGKSYLTYINAEDIRILGVAEGNQAVLETMPEDLVPYTVWSLTTQQINVQLFKCLTISEEEKGKYTIVALQHEPQKEAIVDNGAVFEPRETTLATSGLRKVDNLQVQANGDGIELSFDAIVQNSAMVTYQIKLYRDGNFYKLYDNLTSPKITFVDLPDGEYIAEVRAQNAQGQLSDPVTKTFTVRLAVSELVTVPKMFAIELNWRNPIFSNPKTAIEIWVSSDNQFANARKLVSLAYPTNSYTYSGLSLNDRFWFWVRMVDGDNAGRFTDAVEGQPSQDATALTDYLHGQITKSELGQSLIDSLQADIDTAVDAETQARLAALKAEVTNRTKAIQSESTKLTAKIQAEANARGTAISQLQNIDAQQAQKMTALTAKAEQALSGLEAERIARASGDEAEARERRNLTSRVASAESGLSNLQRTVSTQAQSLSEVSQNLNARFDSLQIGGRNYILSSKSSITSGNVDNGRRYFELSKALPVDVSTLTISVYVNVVGNRNTTYANNNRAGVGVKIEFIDDSVSWFEVWTSKSDIKGRISRTATYNKRIKNIGSVFMLNFLDAQTSIVSDPKVELGTVATDWTPAPEDLEGAVEAVSAKVDSTRETLTRANQALGQRIDTVNASVNDAKAQISTVSRAVATTDGKLSATHTIKTQTIAGGRKAIAGIVLGASGDNRTAESSVIVMADKFGVVKNANDGNVVPMLSVVNNRVAVNGDLIADGTILGKHIRANQTLTSPNINGGRLNIGNGNFIVDSNGNVTAKKGTFSGNLNGATGTFKGDISAASGTFRGKIYAENIIDDTAQAFTLQHGKPLTIPAFGKKRVILIPACFCELRVGMASGSSAATIQASATVTIRSSAGGSVSGSGSAKGSGESGSVFVSGFFVVNANTTTIINYTSYVSGSGSISCPDIPIIAIC
ncbi:Phage-related protein [Avibacterium paragallinarum]|uniref:Phage-related protein n=1 Tax=Avibacterium paragallinarum TaxID=728 RepID=A0A380X4C1_AVIPA|nr:phage tail protein [Avibacterium paragallinarum]SUU97066.1 Phage-related protein [Avibacterium paragallinarum]